MGLLFSSDKKNAKKNLKDDEIITAKDRAILDLKNARDKLKKFRKKLEAESNKLTDEARHLIKRDLKDRALLVLKVKKFKEKEVTNIDGKLVSVHEMIQSVEWEYNNLEVMKALRTGTDALNKIHEQMSLEDVESLLEETNEAIQIENEINGLLAGQFNSADFEELEKELLEICGETTEANGANSFNLIDTLPETPSLPILPEAPTGEIKVGAFNKSVEQRHAERA